MEVAVFWHGRDFTPLEAKPHGSEFISNSARFPKSIVFFSKFPGRGPLVLSVRDRVDEDENGALVE